MGDQCEAITKENEIRVTFFSIRCATKASSYPIDIRCACFFLFIQYQYWSTALMENTQYKVLVKIALGLTIAWVAWSLYDGAFKEKLHGESHYHAANKYFEDGKFDDALISYQKAVVENPQFIHASRGIARSLMMLERYEEALDVFDKVIEKEPEFSASYANRGILHDRMHNYTAAITDYEKAILLNPEISKGPSWITRFLRNQAEKPSTILDRMKYLQAEMSKPEDQRILQLPEKDDEQRPYKL